MVGNTTKWWAKLWCVSINSIVEILMYNCKSKSLMIASKSNSQQKEKSKNNYR